MVVKAEGDRERATTLGSRGVACTGSRRSSGSHVSGEAMSRPRLCQLSKTELSSGCEGVVVSGGEIETEGKTETSEGRTWMLGDATRRGVREHQCKGALGQFEGVTVGGIMVLFMNPTKS